jgi:hypothetical protein
MEDASVVEDNEAARLQFEPRFICWIPHLVTHALPCLVKGEHVIRREAKAVTVEGVERKSRHIARCVSANDRVIRHHMVLFIAVLEGHGRLAQQTSRRRVLLLQFFLKILAQFVCKFVGHGRLAQQTTHCRVLLL